MRPELRSLDFDPDPTTFSSEPSEFSFLPRVIVGPSDGPGEESFDLTVCSPEWLAEACRRVGGIYNPRHHLIVNMEDFDRRALQAWLSMRVQEVQADTWAQAAERLSRLGYWEFEDYRP
jgi:Immunity protein 8